METLLVEPTKEQIIELIKLHPDLKPKQLNQLYPYISTAKFVANHYWLNHKSYEKKRLDKLVSVYSDLVNSMDGGYEDKGYNVKDLVRDKVAGYIFRSGIYGLIGTLPHIKCLTEQKIYDLTQEVTFLGIDKDPYVVKGMDCQRKALELPMKCVVGEVLDVICSYSENSFGHLFLDYCGAMPTQCKSLVYAIENNLVKKNGYIFLTFQRAVRLCKGKYFDIWESYSKSLPMGYTGSKSDYANDKLLEFIIGDKFTLVEKFSYQTGSPMVFYAIKRIK